MILKLNLFFNTTQFVIREMYQIEGKDEKLISKTVASSNDNNNMESCFGLNGMVGWVLTICNHCHVNKLLPAKKPEW